MTKPELYSLWDEGSILDISVEMYRKKNIYVSLDFVEFSKKL